MVVCSETSFKKDAVWATRGVRYLRDFSNYLTPQAGLLSAEHWTLVALFCNLLLTWVVLLPCIAVALMLPDSFSGYTPRPGIAGSVRIPLDRDRRADAGYRLHWRAPASNRLESVLP